MAFKSFAHKNLIQPFILFITLHKPSLKYYIFRKVQCARYVTVHQLNNSIAKTSLPNKYQVDKAEDLDKLKTEIILKLNFKSPEDILPFYKLPIRKLIHIHKVTINDERNGFCKNRLYYLADRIKCSPAVLSTYVAKRTFIYSLSFEWLKSSLDVLLDMGVSGDRIMRDLWVLKYHSTTIEARLKMVKDRGMEVLHPWMVRCTESILQRSIEISQSTKDILGETMSTKIYLANRLNVTPERVEEYYYSVPSLKTIRVTKLKQFLDFLISEGFAINEIADKPRILTASQNTVKERLEKLRKLGINKINLNVLCRCKKDFNKYYESLLNGTEDEEDQNV